MSRLACWRCVAGAQFAVAVVGLLTRHLAITMVGRHGEEKARAMLQKVILDAGEAGQCPRFCAVSGP